MSNKVVELQGLLQPDDPATWVANLWSKWDMQRSEKKDLWGEVDKYLFATDTTTTSNKHLPWVHTTTVPKLTQIRDNLHSNYLSSLFPNDKWLSWVAYSEDAAKRKTAKTITAYMDNKTREGGFRETVSRLLYDYIDKGNAFSQPTFEARYKNTKRERVASFVGPKAVRIAPEDIVFNPLATCFEEAPKIVRSLKTVGELKKLGETDPSQLVWKTAMADRDRRVAASFSYNAEDWNKATQYQVDGFGNLMEYYLSDVVEVLEFYGDYHNARTGELKSNQMITVIDRCKVVRSIDIASYAGEDQIRHVGWRFRPNNLWSMGPLDNLVGMQYMIDHYLNMGANALDLKVMPPKKIIGNVEEFVWAPNTEIHIDEDGDVIEMAQQWNDIFTIRDWITELENRMELYAGAPREAMGIRTPGEKTAFEVQSLENAAGRIFNEKIIQFEVFLEQVLNDMLETAHRNMDFTDTIRVLDGDIGVQEFKQITKEDITANGILRPVGARHFGQRAQELQNLVGVLGSPMAQLLQPHISAIGVTEFLTDVLDLRGYKIFGKNLAISEQQETQALLQQAQEDNAVRGGMTESGLMMEKAMQDEQQAPQ